MTRRLAILLLVPVLLLGSWRPADAEPPAPMAERVKIFDIEMRRGPAKDLVPFLGDDAHPLSKAYALRALGRIGEDDLEAPKVLAAYLGEATDDDSLLPHALWAAGIAQSKDLTDAILGHVKSEKPMVRAAALEALGWAKDPRALAALSQGLADPDTSALLGALTGIARHGFDGLLERVVGYTQSPGAEIRRAADFACWMLAGARKRQALAVNPKWDGDETLVPWFTALMTAGEPGRRMAGLRPLAALLPAKLEAKQFEHKKVGGLHADTDPRVLQDLIWRILRAREGTLVDGLLNHCLHLGDPKVRELAADAYARRGDEASARALLQRYGAEQDARVLEALAIGMARCGDMAGYLRLTDDAARASRLPAPYRALTDLRVHLGVPDEKGVPKALEMLALPKEGGLPQLHAVVMMEACSSLEDVKHEGVDAWARALVPRAVASGDPYIASASIGLAAARGEDAPLHALFAGAASLDPEIRSALVGAAAKLHGKEDCPAEAKAKHETFLRAALDDENAWVREAARKAGAELKLADWPKRDTRQPNDWKGLPRPKTAVLGLALHEGEGAWLTSEEILSLADAIAASNVRVRFKTSQGAFAVRVDPDAAPAHSAALILAVHAGTYTNTRWHRVVPNFVIQGGDPHGHGAGNAGYTIPDEITRRRYVRGALGMPKSTKDDGGCQLFFMHTAYRPLDERYTCYGEITSGLDTVDRIRVGDTIVSAELVID